ncbi:quinon protein alcohol dehydrogenase-like superfamily [Globomyces pollinis-pini]|nr:quinon protein alcohol dehydrogenase-like superfamily [Globomyces pollinis-pini]
MAPQIAPKTFTFINEHCIVAISDKGQFFFYDQKNETSKMFHEDLDFRAYPVLKANRFMLAAGNMNGVLLIISHYDSFKPLKLKICDSKIVSLYLHQDDSSRAYAFLFIGEKKLLLYLVIDFLSENVEITEQREILLPSDFFVTSLYFSIETFLVFLGSRNGSIMAYDVSKSTAALVSFYEKLHGDDAVTSLAITNTEKLLTVYSVGRDGVFSATQLRPPSSPEKSWVFDKVHSSRITRGWLEKIEIVDDTIYLCGFFDKEFFIFNETKNYHVFKIACGGAHRLWNVHIPNLNLVDFRFGYIRKQRIQLVSKTFNPDRKVLNDILQEPYHCLETRVARIFSMNEVTLVATGGENGVLTFHHILKNVGSSKRITSCRKHTGSIRAIGVISNLSNQNGLLFSGGSVQELKCWRIELSNSSLETENVRMSCNELSSANLCSESVDTRVMDLDAIISITDTQMILVATVNSDTSVVLWCYNVEHNSFTKIDVSHKHLRCLLKCKTLSVTIGNHNRILLFTAGTDGKVILWDISENKLQSVSEWTPHQSGIKALSVAEKNGTIFVLSGGDDNAIVLTTINLQSLSSSCVELDTIRIENGHSSSITGCAITKNLQIITCSIDQRLSVRNMDLQLLSETYIDIADVSDLSILSDFICVVGFGMQIFKIK